MCEIVAKMSQVRPLRPDFGEISQRSRKRQVGRMLTLAKAVEHHDVDTLKTLKFRLADFMAVRNVAEAFRPVRHKIAAAGEAVGNAESLDLQPADFKAIRILDELYLRTVKPVRSALRGNVGEDATHRLNRFGQRVAVHGLSDDARNAAERARRVGIAVDARAVYRIEAADVVKPGDMIHVGVGQKHGVHPAYRVLDARFAQFRGSVD